MTPLEAIAAIVAEVAACNCDEPAVLRMHITLTTDDDRDDEPPETPETPMGFFGKSRCAERVRPHKRCPTAAMNRFA